MFLKAGITGTVEYRHEFKYFLRELQEEYLPVLTPKDKGVKKPRRKAKVLHLYNLNSLNHCEITRFDVTSRNEEPGSEFFQPKGE